MRVGRGSSPSNGPSLLCYLRSVAIDAAALNSVSHGSFVPRGAVFAMLSKNDGLSIARHESGQRRLSR